MPQPQDKAQLIAASSAGYDELFQLIESTPVEVLEKNFAPSDKAAKCSTFQQGENLRDLLMHILEWQRLQEAFVENIRKGEPKDFIPDPYRKDYKAMDHANWERHQSVSLSEAEKLLSDSQPKMISLIESFSDEELFGKKVFKVTYTTTMAAYFMSVAVSPYAQTLKKLKSHIRQCKKNG